MSSGSRLCATLLLLCAGSARPALAAGPRSDALYSALETELERSWRGLRHAEKEPLYFLAYEAYDGVSYELNALMGAIHSENERRERLVDVDARVGDPRLDNTHPLKGTEAVVDPANRGAARLPVEDDAAALRGELWLKTDRAYKAALGRYLKVRTNKAVTAAEEDPSGDFSPAPPERDYRPAPATPVDKAALRARLRRISALLKDFPFVQDASVSFSYDRENRYFLSSEGARVVSGAVYVRLGYRIAARTDDGMDLQRYRNYDAGSIEGLPSDDDVLRDLRRSAGELKALLAAPVIEPYTGPAIIRNRAAGVYFHEVLGHRLEGHRQKMFDEGQTFTKMLGRPVVAPFLSVYDDPTLASFRGVFLRGHYAYDDEGVAARRLPLVQDGVLRSFLMSRSPIRGFPASNGHGRRSPGNAVVARMGNTIVEASRSVPYETLRSMLVAEVRRQGKPYGLVLDDITGGYTGTNRRTPQSFKVLPLLVWRVYPDGRPDEAVRGVDLVGTPLTAFGKIVAAGDDPAVFDGTCGAESGWVPVSAVSPSLLVSEIEVEKQAKSSEKPPVLPSPLAERSRP
jgi:predicted Zn-dependent protease